MRGRETLGRQTMVPAARLLEDRTAGALDVGFVMAAPIMLGLHVVLCCMDARGRPWGRRR